MGVGFGVATRSASVRIFLGMKSSGKKVMFEAQLGHSGDFACQKPKQRA
jgi:hypothetical protein